MDCTRRTTLGALALAPVLTWPSVSWSQANGLTFDVPVRADHDDPTSVMLPLPCEWARTPEPEKPTVLLVADAQQFYLRPGGASRIANQFFTTDVNVLSIVGRSRIVSVERLIEGPGGTDWSAAWRLFKSRQWIGDIEAVLRHLNLSAHPRSVMMYGRSGGAFLIQQAIVRNPGIAHRVFMQAGVNHELDVRLGHGPDRFWSDLQAQDIRLSEQLASFLVENPDQRRRAIALLQRMHFFVPADTLLAERTALVRLILDRDETKLESLWQEYQLDALDEIARTPEGIASTVRLAEFALPHPDPRRQLSEVHPDIEQLFNEADAALPFAYSDERQVSGSDWSQLEKFDGEAFMVAARHDQTFDFRTQKYIRGLMRDARLTVLDDNHVFEKLSNMNCLPDILQAFFAKGLHSPSFIGEISRLDSITDFMI